MTNLINPKMKFVDSESTTIDNTIFKFLSDNVSTEPYDLLRYHIDSYDPKIVFDNKISNSLIKRAINDLAIFNSIESSRLKSKKPLVGDIIHRINGDITYLGIFMGDKLQDTNGGSFHVSPNSGSYSGGFTGNVMNTANLKRTNLIEPLFCWIFSGNSAGANRGVHSTINVRVWEEF